MISRQRLSQIRHPERYLARHAIFNRIKRGKLLHPTLLPCLDCLEPAECCDHARGYDNQNRFYIEAVCWKCHIKRGKIRKEYKNKYLS